MFGQTQTVIDTQLCTNYVKIRAELRVLRGTRILSVLT